MSFYAESTLERMRRASETGGGSVRCRESPGGELPLSAEVPWRPAVTSRAAGFAAARRLDGTSQRARPATYEAASTATRNQSFCLMYPDVLQRL